MVCKGLDAILSQIDPTAEVIRRIRPVYHFKAVTESLSESIKTALSAFFIISKSVRSFFAGKASAGCGTLQSPKGKTNSCMIKIHVVYPAHTRYNEIKPRKRVGIILL